MDLTVVLSAVAIAIGLCASVYGAVTGAKNAKFDLAWRMTETRITELTTDKNDLQVRMRDIEKAHRECLDLSAKKDDVIEQLKIQNELLKLRGSIGD